MRRLVSAPALHFLVLGTGLFLWSGGPGTGARGAATAVRAPVVIDATRIAQLREEHQRTMGGAPSEAEMAALIDAEIEEELLYREALLLGLDRGDKVIAWRVIEKMQFIDGNEAGDQADAYRRGIALGLHHDDVVVRKVLVTRMRLLAKAAVNAEEPSEAELTAHLARHAERYRQPATVTLTHVFVSRAARGAAAAAAAEALLGSLVASRAAPDAAVALGDPFPAGHTFRGSSARSLAKVFGDAFAARVMALEPGTWSGPIPSAYGLHLVRVDARRAARVPALDAVRSRVLRAVRAERHERYFGEMVARLRAAYDVRVEQPVPAAGGGA